HLYHLRGTGGISATADCNRSGEQFRSLGNQLPDSVTTIGLTGHVDPLRIDVELALERVQDSDDKLQWRAECVLTDVGPAPRTLRRENKRRIFHLVVRFRPRVRTWNLIAGNLP